jgi:MFS family permease
MATGRYLNRSAVVAALGGLLFGFDTAVIAGATRALLPGFTHLPPGSLGATVTSALVGTVFGAILAGIPSGRYGRRDTLCGLTVFCQATMVVQFVVVLFFYPETKGISLEQMQKKLGIS